MSVTQKCIIGGLNMMHRNFGELRAVVLNTVNINLAIFGGFTQLKKTQV